MSCIASGGSQMPSFSPVFSKFSWEHAPGSPYHCFVASLPAFGSLALKPHWQKLADIFKTYLPIGRLFLFLNATMNCTSITRPGWLFSDWIFKYFNMFKGPLIQSVTESSELVCTEWWINLSLYCQFDVWCIEFDNCFHCIWPLKMLIKPPPFKHDKCVYIQVVLLTLPTTQLKLLLNLINYAPN